jgi:hypothetical protein
MQYDLANFPKNYPFKAFESNKVFNVFGEIFDVGFKIFWE